MTITGSALASLIVAGKADGGPATGGERGEGGGGARVSAASTSPAAATVTDANFGIKVRNSSGRLVYAPPEAAEAERADAIAVAFARWALDVEPSGNLVVVLTPHGYASPLAQAIDVARHPRIAGTIAGENTVLLIAREGVTGAKLAEEIRGHMLRGAA